MILTLSMHVGLQMASGGAISTSRWGLDGVVEKYMHGKLEKAKLPVIVRFHSKESLGPSTPICHCRQSDCGTRHCPCKRAERKCTKSCKCGRGHKPCTDCESGEKLTALVE